MASAKVKDVDVESKPVRKYSTKGDYDRLAKFMGEIPDEAIFRRYADLAAESLLHYQAELLDLKLELKRIQEEDKKCGLDTMRGTYAFHSQKLRESELDEDTSANEADESVRHNPAQWKLIKRIRQVLREYCKLSSGRPS
jgi:hypothetical protein